jgi:hypothetical protein
MSLRGRFTGDAPVPTEPTFTCPHYAPPPGSKRCRHYVSNGACDRPDQLMCVEWLKRNKPEARGDNPEDETKSEFRLEIQEPPATPKSTVPPQPRLPPSDPPPPIYSLKPDAIASFKELGVEVCLASDDIGEVWIVPEYTHRNRKELSIDHAATLAALCAAFPGAKVSAFEKTTPVSGADVN